MGRSDGREKLVGHAYSSNLAKNGTLENGFLIRPLITLTFDVDAQQQTATVTLLYPHFVSLTSR
jgi:hypothetical protein